MNTKEFRIEDKKVLWEAAKAASKSINKADSLINLPKFVNDMREHDHPSFNRCINAVRMIRSVRLMRVTKIDEVVIKVFRVMSQSHEGWHQVEVIKSLFDMEFYSCDCEDWMEDQDRNTRCKHIQAACWSDRNK